MKYTIIGFFFLSCILALSESCKQKTIGIPNISLVCLRDTDTMYVSITNNMGDAIYIPSNYEGTYNVDNDTIFLEVIGKPKYNTNYYYRYKNVFPFEIYTAQKLGDYKADTVIKIVEQTYF
jgi:hypothetical protein